MLKDIFNNFMHRQDRVKEIIEERRAEKIAVQRDKNSNERELERFMEEERQKKIKVMLDQARIKRQKENNQANLLKKDKNIIKQKNMFNSQSMILKERRSFLR